MTLRLDDDPATKRTADGDLYFEKNLIAHRITPLPARARGTFETCRTRTTNARSLKYKKPTSSHLACVITEHGLVGLLKITKWELGEWPDQGLIHFDLTVWQG
ncbi:hypothetical protein [Actinomadura flavalba]|uniref:hypothetical protein n=1 Tax=Actinomadura flavalba TaxID=1120938 RepID=UPI00035D124A|nr:hypothetical protein [Actinomadura flavalba]